MFATENPHESVPPPQFTGGNDNVDNQVDTHCSIVQNKYWHFYYLCDEFDDRGWGCAYRSLQTIFSWYLHQIHSSLSFPSDSTVNTSLTTSTNTGNGIIDTGDGRYIPEASGDGGGNGYIASTCIVDNNAFLSTTKTTSQSHRNIPLCVPSVPDIQRVLDAIGYADLDAASVGDRYFGSSRWIGSSEVCAVLHAMLPSTARCLIRYFSADISEKETTSVSYQTELIELLEVHFGVEDGGGPASPVMCGGASGAALTLLGISTRKLSNPRLDGVGLEAFVLVLDPHWTSSSPAIERRPQWQRLEHVFPPGRFFNLCIPHLMNEESGLVVCDNNRKQGYVLFNKEKTILRLESEALTRLAFETKQREDGLGGVKQWVFEVVDSGEGSAGNESIDTATALHL